MVIISYSYYNNTKRIIKDDYIGSINLRGHLVYLFDSNYNIIYKEPQQEIRDYYSYYYVNNELICIDLDEENNILCVTSNDKVLYTILDKRCGAHD